MPRWHLHLQVVLVLSCLLLRVVLYLLSDGNVLSQAVVEISDGRVVNYFEFQDELPMTEWLGGVIEVKRDEEGILRAFHQGKKL